MSERIGNNEVDQRVALVLQGLYIPEEVTGSISLQPGVPLTKEVLEERLVWDDWLNAAILPLDEQNERGEPLFHVLAAHSTYDTTVGQEPLYPTLRFGEREKGYQTRASNVYGTGFYIANRREAAVRRKEAGQGRQIGVFLTDAISRSEIVDGRRRLLREVWHLGSMVVTEMIAPRILGEQKVAAHIASREDERMDAMGTKMKLLNEAPRGRVEKMGYESDWEYDKVPPQYMLSRVPMLRIGTYERPKDEPQQYGALKLYAYKFWEAAVRNARDMKRLGVAVSPRLH
jgi:hypothetical protein